MKLLEEKWTKLILSEKENTESIVDERTLLEEATKGACNVVENLHAKRKTNKKVLSSTM